MSQTLQGESVNTADAQREYHQEMLRQLQLHHKNESHQTRQFRQDPEHQRNKALAIQIIQQQMTSTDAQQSWTQYEAWIQEQARLARTAKLKRGTSEVATKTVNGGTRRIVRVKRKK